MPGRLPAARQTKSSQYFLKKMKTKRNDLMCAKTTRPDFNRVGKLCPPNLVSSAAMVVSSLLASAGRFETPSDQIRFLQIEGEESLRALVNSDFTMQRYETKTSAYTSPIFCSYRSLPSGFNVRGAERVL